MPNHITTVATVTGSPSQVEAFRVAHIRPIPGESGEHFDFTTIIPVPACVENSDASSTAEEGFFALTGMAQIKFAAFSNIAMQYFRNRQREGFEVNQLTSPEHLRAWLESHHPEVLVAGQKMLTCFRETGCMSWYDWKSSIWGTKWGAYAYEESAREAGRFVFKFETAWSPPRPILEKLAEMWPELTIETESIDEGGGPHFVGKYQGKTRTLDAVPETVERYRRVYQREPDSEDE